MLSLDQSKAVCLFILLSLSNQFSSIHVGPFLWLLLAFFFFLGIIISRSKWKSLGQCSKLWPFWLRNRSPNWRLVYCKRQTVISKVFRNIIMKSNKFNYKYVCIHICLPYSLLFSCIIYLSLSEQYLRVPVHKNGKKLGKGRKFNFAHIFMVDRLGHDKNYWIVFLAKYPFISKKYANYQIQLKSSFDAPFY